MVYSEISGLIYVLSICYIYGFRWEEEKKTLIEQFVISINKLLDCSFITLGPQDTTGVDQIYISVGSGAKSTKNVYRLGGNELEERVLLPDTRYINDQCERWFLASNPHTHILLIHPPRTPFIYIHVEERKHAKVDLNRLGIRNVIELRRIELIGQLLILGDWKENKLYMGELKVTENSAFIKTGSKRTNIKSCFGKFAALSHVLGDEDEELHLFTTKFDKDKDCTDISEYKFNLSVDDSDLNQLSTHALRVKGEFYPYYLVNLNSCSPVLIGKHEHLLVGRLSAVELTKQQVARQV